MFDKQLIFMVLTLFKWEKIKSRPPEKPIDIP